MINGQIDGIVFKKIEGSTWDGTLPVFCNVRCTVNDLFPLRNKVARGRKVYKGKLIIT